MGRSVYDHTDALRSPMCQWLVRMEPSDAAIEAAKARVYCVPVFGGWQARGVEHGVWAAYAVDRNRGVL